MKPRKAKPWKTTKKDKEIIVSNAVLVYQTAFKISQIIRDALEPVPDNQKFYVAARIVNSVWGDFYKPAIKLALEETVNRMEDKL